MRRAKKGSGPPKSDAELMREALMEAEQQHSRRMKEKRRKKNRFEWLKSVPGWGKTALIFAIVVIVALVADGMRRERQEFNATLLSYNGAVTVQAGGQGNRQTPRAKMGLADKDVVRTGGNGSATLVFPDGSSIELEPNTEFEVRLLDYARGGRRDRSFMLRAGSAVAKVSHFFGAGSQATVCTPTAVAAVRGTGFRVVYDPTSRQTFLQVADGQVAFKTPSAVQPVNYKVGQMVMAAGYEVQLPRDLPASRGRVLGTQLTRMGQHEKPPNVLERLEMALNEFLDPFLQILGLAPGSWSYATNDFARRAACMEALKQLRVHILAAGNDDVPEMLNPVTLQELNIPVKDYSKVVNGLASGMLESYRKLGKDNFEVYARARNKRRTLFKMTPSEITEVKEQG